MYSCDIALVAYRTAISVRYMVVAKLISLAYIVICRVYLIITPGGEEGEAPAS